MDLDLDADGNDVKTNININILSKIRCTCDDNCICPFFKRKEKCLYCSNIENDKNNSKQSQSESEEIKN